MRDDLSPTTLGPSWRIRLAAGLVAVASTAGGLVACGGGGGTAAPAPAPGPTPIVVPDRSWSFVPIDGARCANGSATGIGLRPASGARQLLIYFEGGGGCADGDTCWGNAPGGASNLNGYGAADFAAEPKLTQFPYFDASANSPNPFAGMHMAMLPYCTGDVHGGTQVRTLPVTGSTPRETHFVGALNAEKALARLAATYPELDAVWVLGTSAGGGGATLHYDRVRRAFGTRVHLIVDSAPGFPDGDEAQKWSVWGLQTPCAGCASAADVRRWNRTLDAGARQAFLSFRYDPTTANGLSLQDFDLAMTALLAEWQAHPNSRTFIADNSTIGYGPPTLHVVTTKRSPASLAAAHLGFVGAMVSGSGWANTTFTLP